MLSVIIPTYNEAENIGRLVNFLLSTSGEIEVIISDGGSSDDTCSNAINAGATVLASPKKGRAQQMNYGASFASGEVLYFVHADTFPPESFAEDIQTALKQGYSFGRYRTAFQSKSLLLKLNAWFTRFDLFVCYGGDQTFFITRELFDTIGGYRGDMAIMEDYDITVRAKANGRYKIMPGYALISARKYETNSWFKVQSANYKIVKMYRNGAAQQEMVRRYKELLNYR